MVIWNDMYDPPLVYLVLPLDFLENVLETLSMLSGASRTCSACYPRPIDWDNSGLARNHGTHRRGCSGCGARTAGLAGNRSYAIQYDARRIGGSCCARSWVCRVGSGSGRGRRLLGRTCSADDYDDCRGSRCVLRGCWPQVPGLGRPLPAGRRGGTERW